MPAGVTWGVYIRYSCAAFLSMMAGAQFVHVYYRPLEDLEELVKKEKERMCSDHVTLENVKSAQETITKSLIAEEDAKT